MTVFKYKSHSCLKGIKRSIEKYYELLPWMLLGYFQYLTKEKRVYCLCYHNVSLMHKTFQLFSVSSYICNSLLHVTHFLLQSWSPFFCTSNSGLVSTCFWSHSTGPTNKETLPDVCWCFSFFFFLSLSLFMSLQLVFSDELLVHFTVNCAVRSV